MHHIFDQHGVLIALGKNSSDCERCEVTIAVPSSDSEDNLITLDVDQESAKVIASNFLGNVRVTISLFEPPRIVEDQDE